MAKKKSVEKKRHKHLALKAKERKVMFTPKPLPIPSSKKPIEIKEPNRICNSSKLETAGLIFYSIVCALSLLMAFFTYYRSIILFYFFVCVSIFSSIILLWWGGSKKGIVQKKASGKFLKMIFWLGFMLIMFYFYKFFSAKYEMLSIGLVSSINESISYIILLIGLGLMFLSLLTANLLYRKHMKEWIKEKKVLVEAEKKRRRFLKEKDRREEKIKQIKIEAKSKIEEKIITEAKKIENIKKTEKNNAPVICKKSH